MDILEHNLSQLLPSRYRTPPRVLNMPAAEHTEKATPLLPSKEAENAPEDNRQQQLASSKLPNIVGDRGVAYGKRCETMLTNLQLTLPDEAKVSNVARRCNEAFLNCLLNHLKLVDILVLLYMDPLGAMLPRGVNTNRLDSDRNKRLEAGVAIASKIIPEVQRLGTHPELFSDELQEAHFLEKAGILAYRSRELLDISDQLDKMDPSKHKNLDTAAAKRSADPKTGVKMQPWETFAGPLDSTWLTLMHCVKEMRTQQPDMLPFQGLSLPPGAVMIAEHNRQRENWYIGSGINQPTDILALQHSNNALLDETNIRVGVEAFVKRTGRMPAQESQVIVRTVWCFRSVTDNSAEP